MAFKKSKFTKTKFKGKSSSDKPQYKDDGLSPIFLKSVKLSESQKGDDIVTAYMTTESAQEIKDQIDKCSGDYTIKLQLFHGDRESRDGQTFKSGFIFVRDAIPRDDAGRIKNFKKADKNKYDKSGKSKVLGKSKKSRDEDEEEEE